jgi:NADPH2:quinone reductase
LDEGDGQMRAAVLDRFGPPETLRIREIERPQPSAGEILVEVVAAGINPVDAHNRRDGSWAGIELPAVLGSDASGIVSEVGPGVVDVRVGDEVFYFSDFLGSRGGSYAEYQAVDAAIVATKPVTITHAEAAAVPLAAGTAYEVIQRRLAISTSESILIFGAAGGVGTYAVQLARIAGARIVAVAGREAHELLRELGATVTTDYDNVEAAVRSSVGEVDGIADLVGKSRVPTSLPLVRAGGRVASIVELIGDFDAAIDRNVTVHGVLVRPDGERLRHLADLLERKLLRPLVTSEYALDDVVAAHRRIEERHGRGKVVLRIRPERPGAEKAQ